MGVRVEGAARHRRAWRHDGGCAEGHRRAQARLQGVRRAAEGEGRHRHPGAHVGRGAGRLGHFLKVKFIQRKDCAALESAYLMDEGSTISWTPYSAKLASEVGVKLASYSEDWYGNEVDVVEMDGAVDKLEEIIYLESQMCNTGTKFYGELTEQIVKNKDAPGSDNGTGLMQTLCSFKIREVYEKLTAK